MESLTCVCYEETPPQRISDHVQFYFFVRRVLQTHEYLFNQRASIVEKLSLLSIDGALNSIRVSSEWNI